MSKVTLNCASLNKVNEKIKKLRFAVNESKDIFGEIHDIDAYHKLQQYKQLKKKILLDRRVL